MEGKWTYALSSGWNNELFNSKEEALQEGKKLGDKEGFMVGQLKEFCGTYYAENREWIEGGKLKE